MSIKEMIINANKERERKKRIESCKKIATGATVGVAVGLIIGILFAPKAGRDTREDIKEGLGNAKDSVVDAAKVAKAKASEIAHDVKNKSAEVVTQIKEKAKEIVDSAKGELDIEFKDYDDVEELKAED